MCIFFLFVFFISKYFFFPFLSTLGLQHGISHNLISSLYHLSKALRVETPMLIIQTIVGVLCKTPLGTCACNVALVLGPLLYPWSMLSCWPMYVPTMFDHSHLRHQAHVMCHYYTPCNSTHGLHHIHGTVPMCVC